MKINYDSLLLKIYQKVNTDLVLILISDASKQHLTKIVSDLFNEELGNLFNESIFDLDGHHESYYDGKSVSEVFSANPKDRLVNDIKENLMNSLQCFVDTFIEHSKKGSSFEDIKQEIINGIYNFEYLPVIRDDYCFTCGFRSAYYIRDGVISNKAKLSESEIAALPIDEKFKKVLPHLNPKEIKACCFPNGIEQYDFKIKIKSKQLVFANNLTKLFNVSYSTNANYISDKAGHPTDINSELGLMYNQEFWNEKGLIYVQTGNSSPKIYKDSVTGTIAAIEPTAKFSKDIFPIPVSNMKKVGSVCTDVWAVSAMDMALFKKECKKNKMDVEQGLEEFGAFVVDIEPGNYKVTSYNASKYYSKPIFFTIEKI